MKNRKLKNVCVFNVWTKQAESEEDDTNAGEENTFYRSRSGETTRLSLSNYGKKNLKWRFCIHFFRNPTTSDLRWTEKSSDNFFMITST